MCKNDDKMAKRREEEEILALLSLVRAGKASALARLIHEYHALLQSRISAFHFEGAALDDAYSDASLALYRAALRYREGMGVTFGLYAKICIDNALKTGYRKSRVGNSASDAPVDLVSFEEADAVGLVADFSDPVLEEEGMAALLSQIMRELSPYEKTVFTLYYIHGIAASEIAKQLGKSEKSVKNAISRLVIKLRKRLGP